MAIIINSAQGEATVPLDAFMGSIRLYAPTVAEPTAYMAIRQAAIEFCEKTRMWREEDDYANVAGTNLDVSVPDGAVLIEFETVSFEGGEPLDPATTQWLDRNYRGWRTNASPGTPRYVTQLATNTMRLVPGMDGAVRVSVWMKPDQDCMEMPSFLSRQHRETIAHGALARILAIPNQPFTNLEMASAYLSLFKVRLSELAHAGSSGQQRARARSKAHPY